MTLAQAITELRQSEAALADRLHHLSAQHATEHEIHHVARELARWSERHVEELTEAGNRYGLAGESVAGNEPGMVTRAVRKAAGIAYADRAPASPLLRALRDLYRESSAVSVDWELLGQGAQAAKDIDLLSLTQRCHPDTLRQLRWANTMLKTLSPQIIASQ